MNATRPATSSDRQQLRRLSRTPMAEIEREDASRLDDLRDRLVRFLLEDPALDSVLITKQPDGGAQITVGAVDGGPQVTIEFRPEG